MMNISISTWVIGLLVSIFLLGGQAHAKEHHQHHHPQHHIITSNKSVVEYSDGRPGKWCGWQMRQWFGGSSEYNVARAWARRGVSTVPHVPTPGNIVAVVWPHHVGYITGYDQKSHRFIVKSGNDGHQVRERPRSLSGAIAFRSLNQLTTTSPTKESSHARQTILVPKESKGGS